MDYLEGPNPVDFWAAKFFHFGWCGVDLFFVLSGFLITGILYDAKSSAHFLRNFYARRVLRIFPLYYAVVFFSLVILTHIHHPKAQNFGRITGDEWWYWLHLSNLSIARCGLFRHAILDVCWSLSIEEQFYFLWPLLVLLFSRRTLMGIASSFIVVAIAVRVYMLMTGWGWISVSAFTLSRCDGLAAGALLALAVRGPGGVRRSLAFMKPICIASIIALAVAIAWGGSSQETSKPLLAIGYTALAGIFAAVITLGIAAPQGSLLNRFFSCSLLTIFGRLSYALYLCHISVRAAIRDTVYGPNKFITIAGSKLPGQMLFSLTSIVASVLVAWLSWHLFEKHFLSLKRFFPAAKTKTAE